MSYVWSPLSCWMMDDCLSCSWYQWNNPVFRNTSPGSWTLSTPVCATGWKHVCLLVSAGTQRCSQMNLWYILPNFPHLSSPALASQTPEGYLEVVVYASPALSSWFTSLPTSQMHPVSLSWAFVLFLFPTGVWPGSKTHLSLHYHHVSTLLSSMSYDTC